MKKVLFYDKSGISKEVNDYKGGGFFKYYELEQFDDVLKKITNLDIDKIVWYGIIVMKEVKTWIVVNYRLYNQQTWLFICTLIKMKCT